MSIFEFKRDFNWLNFCRKNYFSCSKVFCSKVKFTIVVYFSNFSLGGQHSTIINIFNLHIYRKSCNLILTNLAIHVFWKYIRSSKSLRPIFVCDRFSQKSILKIAVALFLQFYVSKWLGHLQSMPTHLHITNTNHI